MGIKKGSSNKSIILGKKCSIDYNTEGKWSVDSVKAMYWEMCLSLGGIDGFEPMPRVATNNTGFVWIYNIMESVVDGVQLGDNTCVQIAIEYIAYNEMRPTTGYIRERMARALRHVDLTRKQKDELARIFLKQLESGQLYK